jgi:hypothetical protein
MTITPPKRLPTEMLAKPSKLALMPTEVSGKEVTNPKKFPEQKV